MSKTLLITASVSVPDDAIAQATIVAAAGAPTAEFTKALNAAIKAAGGKETAKVESEIKTKQGPRAKKVAAPAAVAQKAA